jgi:hypothetical protein
MTAPTIVNPYVRSWDVTLYKGINSDFDESEVGLLAPSFLATDRNEALYYAATSLGNDDNHRRVVEYGSTRALILLSIDVDQNVNLAASTLGIDMRTLTCRNWLWR